jgi:hypothetical protein
VATNRNQLDPKNEKKLMNITEVLNAISDNKSLVLFNTIASKGGDSTILISNLRLSRKQYYTRMSSLHRCGLIKKASSGYAVTSFGKIVYNALNKIENAINYLWKLAAIDSLDASADKIPKEERRKIIDTIIDSEEMKQVLLSGEFSVPQDTHGRALASLYTRYTT